MSERAVGIMVCILGKATDHRQRVSDELVVGRLLVGPSLANKPAVSQHFVLLS